MATSEPHPLHRVVPATFNHPFLFQGILDEWADILHDLLPPEHVHQKSLESVVLNPKTAQKRYLFNRGATEILAALTIVRTWWESQTDLPAWDEHALQQRLMMQIDQAVPWHHQQQQETYVSVALTLAEQRPEWSIANLSETIQAWHPSKIASHLVGKGEREEEDYYRRMLNAMLKAEPHWKKHPEQWKGILAVCHQEWKQYPSYQNWMAHLNEPHEHFSAYRTKGKYLRLLSQIPEWRHDAKWDTGWAYRYWSKAITEHAQSHHGKDWKYFMEDMGEWTEKHFPDTRTTAGEHCMGAIIESALLTGGSVIRRKVAQWARKMGLERDNTWKGMAWKHWSLTHEMQATWFKSTQPTPVQHLENTPNVYDAVAMVLGYVEPRCKSRGYPATDGRFKEQWLKWLQRHPQPIPWEAMKAWKHKTDAVHAEKLGQQRSPNYLHLFDHPIAYPAMSIEQGQALSALLLKELQHGEYRMHHLSKTEWGWAVRTWNHPDNLTQIWRRWQETGQTIPVEQWKQWAQHMRYEGLEPVLDLFAYAVGQAVFDNPEQQWMQWKALLTVIEQQNWDNTTPVEQGRNRWLQHMTGFKQHEQKSMWIDQAIAWTTDKQQRITALLQQDPEKRQWMEQWVHNNTHLQNTSWMIEMVRILLESSIAPTNHATQRRHRM